MYKIVILVNFGKLKIYITMYNQTKTYLEWNSTCYIYYTGTYHIQLKDRL